MNTTYFFLLIFLWISPLSAMIKPDKQEHKKMPLAQYWQLFTHAMDQLGREISDYENRMTRYIDDHIEETRRTITLTCNGPGKYTQQQKRPAALAITPQSEEQTPPINSTPTVYIPEPTGLYPADGQEKPLPQPASTNSGDSVNTESLVALFITKNPQYLPGFLEYCGRNHITIDPNSLAQELKKTKSPDQQQLQ